MLPIANTDSIKDARVQLLTGEKGINTRLNAYKQKYRLWELSPNTENLIEALDNFSKALDKFLLAVDERISRCERIKVAIILGTPLEPLDRLEPLENVLQELKNLQEAMGPLAYSMEVESKFEKDSKNYAAYKAARKLIDDVVNPLIKSSTIEDLVRPLELKTGLLGMITPENTKMPLGYGEFVKRTMALLAQCHLANINHYSSVSILIKTLLLQIVTPKSAEAYKIKNQIRKDEVTHADEVKLEYSGDISDEPAIISDSEEVVELVTNDTDEIAKAKFENMIINVCNMDHSKLTKLYDSPTQIDIIRHIDSLKELIIIPQLNKSVLDKLTKSIEDKIKSENSDKTPYYTEILEKIKKLSSAPEQGVDLTKELEDYLIDKIYKNDADEQGDVFYESNIADQEGDIFHETNITDIYKEIFSEIVVAKQAYIEKNGPLDLTVDDLWEKLEEKVESMPIEIRGYVQRALRAQAREETLPVTQWLLNIVDSPPVSQRDNSQNSPLIIHMAGTNIGQTNARDTLAQVVREYTNFEIKGGTKNIVRGGGGDQTVSDMIVKLEKMTPRPKHLVLTGFSRGASVQLELANEIHRKFNAGKDSSEWITIDMFLIDPAYGGIPLYGSVDEETAATQNKKVPRCVNTLNILYSDDPTAEDIYGRFTQKHQQHELEVEPEFTTLQTLTLQGTHNDLGWPLEPTEVAHFINIKFRQFLDNAGCKATKGSQDRITGLDENYIKTNIISAKQDLSIAYTASDARLYDPSISNEKKKSIQYTHDLSAYVHNIDMKAPSEATAEQKYYHEAIKKIQSGIQRANYTTYSLANMPRYMSKMKKIIDSYKALSTDPNNAKNTFKQIQREAKNALNTWSPSRTSEVQHFYENIAKTPEPTFEPRPILAAQAILDVNIDETARNLLLLLQTNLKQKQKEAGNIIWANTYLPYLKPPESKNEAGITYNTLFNYFQPNKTLLANQENIKQSCEYILTGIEDLIKLEVGSTQWFEKLSTFETYIINSPKPLNDAIKGEILTKISSFKSEANIINQGKLLVRSALKFDEIANQVLVTVKKYEQYSEYAQQTFFRQGSFSLDSKNVALPHQIELLVNYLKAQDKMPVEDKLAILTLYIKNERVAADERHHGRSAIPSLHRTFTGSESRLVKILRESEAQIIQLANKGTKIAPPTQAMTEQDDRYINALNGAHVQATKTGPSNRSMP